MRKDSHCRTAAVQIISERQPHRNVAFFFHLGMVFDTLLSESKADSVDICIHINNKTVQYKYKDSVCVCVYTTRSCK